MPEPINYLAMMQGEKSILPALQLGIQTGLQMPTSLENQRNRALTAQTQAQTANIEQATQKGIALLPYEMKQAGANIGLTGAQTRNTLANAGVNETQESLLKTKDLQAKQAWEASQILSNPEATPEEIALAGRKMMVADPEKFKSQIDAQLAKSDAESNSQFEVVRRVAAASQFDASNDGLSEPSVPKTFEILRKAAEEAKDKPTLDFINFYEEAIKQHPTQATNAQMMGMLLDPRLAPKVKAYFDMINPQRKLSASAEKEINALSESSVKAAQTAENVDSLINRIDDAVKKGEYNYGSVSGRIASAASSAGYQTADQVLKNELKSVVNTELLGNLKSLKGATSNKEMEQLKKGIPNVDVDHPDTVKAWLTKFGRLSQTNAAMDNLNANWIRNFGDLASPVGVQGLQVDGLVFPRGTTYQQAVKAVENTILGGKQKPTAKGGELPLPSRSEQPAQEGWFTTPSGIKLKKN